LDEATVTAAKLGTLLKESGTENGRRESLLVSYHYNLPQLIKRHAIVVFTVTVI
jgi:hypothetical protein